MKATPAEAFADQSSVDTEEIKRLADEYDEVDRLVEEADALVKERKAEREEAGQRLTDAMGDLLEFKFKDGREIQLRHWVSAKDSQATQDWMVENDRGGLIKNWVTAVFDQGSDEEARQLAETLAEDGYTIQNKTWIVNQTLVAEIKRMIKAGVEFPRDVMNVHEGFKPKIVRPK